MDIILERKYGSMDHMPLSEAFDWMKDVLGRGRGLWRGCPLSHGVPRCCSAYLLILYKTVSLLQHHHLVRTKEQLSCDQVTISSLKRCIKKIMNLQFVCLVAFVFIFQLLADHKLSKHFA